MKKWFGLAAFVLSVLVCNNSGHASGSGVIESTPYLELMSFEPIAISPTDGRTVWEARSFFGDVDSAFQDQALNAPSAPTSQVKALIYRTKVKDATSEELFGGFERSAEKICFAQSQISGFPEDGAKWLSRSEGTLFLLKGADGKFYVADISLDARGVPRVDKYDLLDDTVIWKADARYQVVIPLS